MLAQFLRECRECENNGLQLAANAAQVSLTTIPIAQMSRPSEAELALAAQNGDREAMGQLLLGQYDELVQYLTPRLPEPVTRHLSVDDVVQQAFARAFTEIQRFEYRGKGSFGAWLRSIADHRLQDGIKLLRRKKRGGDRVQIEAPLRTADSIADLMAMLPGNDPTASRVLRHREAQQAMRVAIAELPDDYRDVIQWRYLEGRSIKETAELMGRSEASVRSLAERAKKKLREALGRLSAYLSNRGC